MALEGKIKDFGIAEILQLIGQQQKTGTLTIAKKKAKVDIAFQEGMIVSIDIDSQKKRGAIGELLVKASLITREQLKQALKIQEETLGQLGNIFLKLGNINKEILSNALAIQIHERIYQILQWKEGKYQFNPGTINGYDQFLPPLNLEHILMDVLQMMDEWPAIREKISSFNLVFQKTPGKKMEEAKRIKFFPEEKKIYNLVDGTKTVQEIIDQSLLGKFITSKSFMNLWDKNYIEKAGVKDFSLETKSEKRTFSWIYSLLSYGGLAVLAIILLVYLRTNLNNIFPLYQIWGKGVGFPQDYLIKVQKEEASNALEIYRLENDRYPETLEELLRARILPEKSFHYFSPDSYYYQRKGDDYLLEKRKKNN